MKRDSIKIIVYLSIFVAGICVGSLTTTLLWPSLHRKASKALSLRGISSKKEAPKHQVKPMRDSTLRNMLALKDKEIAQQRTSLDTLLEKVMSQTITISYLQDLLDEKMIEEDLTLGEILYQEIENLV